MFQLLDEFCSWKIFRIIATLNNVVLNELTITDFRRLDEIYIIKKSCSVLSRLLILSVFSMSINREDFLIVKYRMYSKKEHGIEKIRVVSIISYSS